MSPDVPRRSLFAAGMGLTLAAVGLSACSSPTDTSTGGGAVSNTVKKADVPVGGGIIMASARFVVTQPTAGTYKAFSSICTHQGCPVSEITNGAITCNCHGSQFSVKDGSVINGPARKALAAATITQSGDSLVIS